MHLVSGVLVGEQYITEEVFPCCDRVRVNVSRFGQCRGGLRTRSAPGSRSLEASAGAVTKIGDNSTVVLVDASYGRKCVADVVDDLGRGGRSGGFVVITQFVPLLVNFKETTTQQQAPPATML